MANNKSKRKSRSGDNEFLTKSQARAINKGNRQLSGNINSLLDDLNSITYGIQKTDKVDTLNDEFEQLFKTEMDSLKKVSNGDTTSFFTKLLSDINKRTSEGMSTLEDLFNIDGGQISAYIQDQYKNRLIKQADLAEISSQLVELDEAITVTRDAITSANVITGHMTRDLRFRDSDIDGDPQDYVPIVEQVEKKLKLQEKIKNFIIPRSLGAGECYAYTIPYSKIFEDFSKEKNQDSNRFMAYKEAVESETTLYDYVYNNSKVSEERRKKLFNMVTESVHESKPYKISQNIGEHPTDRKILSEFDSYLKNVSVNNSPIPIPILEEGIESYREYYNEFVEKVVTEKNNDSEISFEKIMKDTDIGIHLTGEIDVKNKNKKAEKFSDIKDCYIKIIDAIHMQPIEIMDEVIGYYYIMDEDITATTGVLSASIYTDTNDTKGVNNVLDSIADVIVSSFDKKFLESNMQFKKLIVESLTYYKLNNKKVKFQFIPKEYVHAFKINEDESGHGRSILEKSLFYAKLYLMLMIFKIMTIISNSNDTKINYVRTAGIDKNISNKVQDIIRRKQQQKINLTDMFSYTTLINKIGQGSEIYMPVGRANERGMETEILAGQDVQLNTELMETLRKGYISGTGVPDVLMNYLNEADFAKTLELANNRFHGRVVSFQLDYNSQITQWYKDILRYSTTLPDSVIDSFEFVFNEPKYSNSNVTNELLNNHETKQNFLVTLFFGADAESDPKNTPKIKKFKLLLAKSQLQMLNFDEMEKIYETSCLEGTEENLNPNRGNDDE